MLPLRRREKGLLIGCESAVVVAVAQPFAKRQVSVQSLSLFHEKKKARVLFCYGGYCREEPMFEKEKVEEAVEWCYGALLNEAAIERERESHRLQHHIGKTNMQ